MRDEQSGDPYGGKVPSGFRELDDLFQGGMPRGSFVLLAGDIGAGAPEFASTSAALLTMARDDPELFDMYYGSGIDTSTVPEEVHYVSFTRSRRDVSRELESVLGEEMFESLDENMQFVDFSESYFHNTPVPRSWVTEGELDLRNLVRGKGRAEDLLPNLASYLEGNAAGNLVVLNSLTPLVRSSKRQRGWGALLNLFEGVQKVSKRWGGLIYGLLDKETLGEREYKEFASISDGVLLFEWRAGGTERQRNLTVHSFRGLMGAISEETIRYDTEVTDEGFEISSKGKIR